MTVRVEQKISAPRESVWQAWLDVEGSPRWDHDVRWSRLGGDFRRGTRGEFELTSGLRVPFELTEVTEGLRYSNVARFAPGLHVLFTHELTPCPRGQVHVMHGARIGGPLGRLLAPLLRRPLEQALGRALARLAALIEREAGLLSLVPEGASEARSA